VTPEMIERLTELILAHSEKLVGCPWSVEDGPALDITFGGFPGTLELIHAKAQAPVEPAQFQLMQLCKEDRAFRDLAVNPVAAALISTVIGLGAARFSSHNCFVKWKGDGYGEKLGLHVDQGLPSPLCLNANCNWALTEYTLEDGPLAVIPGSHLRGVNFYQEIGLEGMLDAAVAEAVPVVCPKGSLIVFHGKLWHGAFPRQNDGLRLTLAYFWRHMSIVPQDDIPNDFPVELAEDCIDPKAFKKHAGFGGTGYHNQALPVPKVAKL
jgi:ectoine hydroxylase-related dioxygenase (phytanoyl-CoA dioxygenase family)